MKRIYFVRHGESEGNISGKWHGEEGSLTELGREQAAFLGERFKKIPTEVLISSPVLRAKQTAAFITEKTGLPVEYSALFSEQQIPEALKSLPEKNSPEAQSILQTLLEHAHDPAWHYDSEENIQELGQRAAAALMYLRERPEETIAVVTHGMFLRALVASMLFGDSYSIEEYLKIQQFLVTRNTGITVAEWDNEHAPDRWRLITWNDHAHLG